MKETFKIINRMVEDGVIENYAVGGAIGALFYVEAFATEDIDIFVTMPPQTVCSFLLMPIPRI